MTMKIDFLSLLKRLYEASPDGCVCIEYWEYDYCPFCKEDILNKMISRREDEMCANVEYTESIPSPIELLSDNCFLLDKKNLQYLEDILIKYVENGEEIIDGSLAYFIEGKLLFCALNFIDTVMPPEVVIDNIGISLDKI